MGEISPASEEDLAALEAAGQQNLYPAGAYVVLKGEEADSLYLLREGSVAVLLEEDEGEIVLGYHVPGDIFGNLGLHTPEAVRTATVRARTEAVIYKISYARFLKLAETRPVLWQLLLEQLSRQLLRSSEKVRLLTSTHATQRILFILAELARLPESTPTSEGVLVSVTREELGNVAGCTREKASRSLTELSQSGVIELQGRKVLLKRRYHTAH